ncbi:hypothetical protein IG193_02785 [Infirmifilum lucidum]|uniref:Uncharacterized protein n=1 Tax=Infirmifilum lucidum TaxID=2776706 RepID=A0A7L9FKR8_9CREN|nr:hypothetical protein [Infirmifilum lucidum]QOJ79405.1 hypothetical protein IG193_02785 [Infirmifilum lucidum]
MRAAQAEVVATLLLMAIAVALWALAWNFFYPTWQQISQRIERERLASEKGLREYLLVELLEKNSSTNTICVHVTNTGDVSSEIVSVYLNGTLAWSGYAPIPAGQSKSICTSFTAKGTYNVGVCSYTNCFEARDYVVP